VTISRSGFEHRDDADRFLCALRERFSRFGLELHPDKTRLIEFGRCAAERRRARGLGKPETFTYLGFTHTSARAGRGGRFSRPAQDRVETDAGQAQAGS
jgi:RNA-directed DNA polymerase